MDNYTKGKLRRSDVIIIRNYGTILKYIPNAKNITLKQSVINKAVNKHSIPITSLRDLPEKLHDPIIAFKSTRTDTNGVVAVIDAVDKDGNNVVVAIDIQAKFNNAEVNNITSLYGKDSYDGYASWAENIIAGDDAKLKTWIESLPENDSRGVSKSKLAVLQEKLNEVLSTDKGTTNNPSPQATDQKTSETSTPAGDVGVSGDAVSVNTQAGESKPSFSITPEVNNARNQATQARDEMRQRRQEREQRTRDLARQLAEDRFLNDGSTLTAADTNAVLRYLRGAARDQRGYDTDTAKAVTGLAKAMQKAGLFNGLTDHEVSMTLTAIKNAVGREDLQRSTDRLHNERLQRHMAEKVRKVRKKFRDFNGKNFHQNL